MSEMRSKNVIQVNMEGKIEGTEWQERSLKRLLDDCKKGESAGNWKRKHEIARCGDLALKGVVGLSQGRLCADDEMCGYVHAPVD
jgi:hypothetical protein